jgi:UDP-N-acetylmuramyl pentapeptide phosphotransferase/UDP-N-acetylglucosamine-1-phosphate transferase
VGVIITFLWIIGLTNAYNFMDGIDGIAGGVALAAALGWMMLASNMHNLFVFWIALAIAASSLGFLGHNWSPAKIFMGDVASTFLGYTFAALPLLSADQGGDALMLGTLLMWTFILDTSITFFQRLFKGEKLLYGHRSHLYQRLVIGGYSHAAVSTLYIVLTLFAGLLSYAWSWGQVYAPPLIIIGLPLIWILLSRYVARLNSLTTKDTKGTKGF